MKRIKLLSIISIILFASIIVFGVSETEFEKLMSNIANENYAPVEEFLKLNKNKLARDPEYYVILINYVMSKGEKTEIVVGKGKAKHNDIVITGQPNTNTENVTGFIGPRSLYDEDLIADGISQTQSALKFFKSRLDIHFGIVSMAERIKRWDILGEQLVIILKTSKEIQNKWVWGAVNSMDGDPKDFMIQNILPRTATLFRAKNPTADAALMNVSKAMIEYYPDEIYGYANLGALHFAKNELERAEKYFKQALKINPNDQIVLKNLERLRNIRK